MSTSPFENPDHVEYIRNNYNPTYQLTKSEALTYATGMGASDSARGISQMFSNAIGWDTASEALKKKDKKLRAVFEHPEFGTEAMIAFLSSAIVADPITYVPIVGWMSKGKKAKTLYDFTKYGTASGALVSSLGYVPEDLDGFVVDKDAPTLAKRAEYTVLGGAGGATIAALGGKIVNKIQVARGKGSIFGEPDEVVSKSSSADTPPSVSSEPLKLGQTVRAPDRNNVGTIIDIDEESGTAVLRFVNKKNGTTATKKFTLDELQPPKPGQARQTPSNVKGDDAAEQSSEIKFIVDEESNPKTLLYKTVDKVTGKMYTIKRALNEQNKVIEGQWEIIIQRRQKVKVKGRKRKKTKVVYEDTKITGSLEEAKAFVKKQIREALPSEPAPSKIIKNIADDSGKKPDESAGAYINPFLKQYQDLLGSPIKNLVFNNIGESLSAIGGYTYGYSSVDDPNATYAEKVTTGLAYSFAAAAGTKGLKAIDNRFNQNALTDVISRGIIDGYKLDDSYLLLRQEFRNEKSTINHKFLQLQQEISEKLSPEESKLLWQFMVGEIDDISPELLSINNKAREQITEYAQELVNLGLLDETIFLKNINTYLKRSYLKHKKDKGTRVFDTNNQIRLIGDELKPRGMTDEVSVKAFNNPESAWQKEGWEILQELKGDKLKVRRDYTKAERIDMEEIEDASYALAETGRLFANDIATGRFLNKIAKQYGIDEADYKLLPDIDKKNYEKLGEEFIKGTKKPKYGNLSGMYVPKEVATDIKHVFSFSTEGEQTWKVFGRELDSLQTLWKKFKTVWNPATHLANSASNVMLLDFAGTELKYLSKAIKEMYKADKSDINVQAKIAGIYDVNLINKELNSSLSAIEKSMIDLQNAPFGRGIIGYSKSMLKQAKKYTLDKAEDMYGVEDSVFRLAVYMDRLDKGFSPEDAALDARKWFIDYDISAPFIVGLKRTILPFVSYTYRVMPLLAEGVIMRPHKLAKWAALGYGMNAIGQGIAGEDKADDEIQRLTMRESQSKRMFSGVPIIGENMPYTQIRLPFNSVNGDPLFLDVERWIPGGDVFSQRETSEVGIPGLPTPFQPGGLYVDAIANFIFKVDPFTGTEIDQSEGRMPLLKHFLKRIPPNIPGIPGTYATEKLKKAKSPDDIITNPNFQDSYFTSPSGYWESLAYTFGIKLRPQNLKVNQDVKDLENDKKVKELENRRYELEDDFREEKVTQEEYNKQLTKLEEEAIRLAAEYEIYLSKVRELQEAKGQRAIKYSGGIVTKMSQRKSYRNGLSVEKDVPDVEDNPADRSIDGTGQSFREVAGQNTEAKTPIAVTNVPLLMAEKPKVVPIEKTREKSRVGRPIWRGLLGDKEIFYSERTVTFPLNNEGTQWVTFPNINEQGLEIGEDNLRQYVLEQGPVDPITGEKFPIFKTEKEASSYASKRSPSLRMKKNEAGIVEKALNEIKVVDELNNSKEFKKLPIKVQENIIEAYEGKTIIDSSSIGPNLNFIKTSPDVSERILQAQKILENREDADLIRANRSAQKGYRTVFPEWVEASAGENIEEWLAKRNPNNYNIPIVIGSAYTSPDAKIKKHEVYLQEMEEYKQGLRAEKPPKQVGVHSHHITGNALDLNQDFYDGIGERAEGVGKLMKGGRTPDLKAVFSALESVGFKQHPEEWWHWSVGEFDH